jgi:ferredoxin-NAD(P)+ reductase (naphthalene dioxygenase ferredoxin-specific)
VSRLTYRVTGAEQATHDIRILHLEPDTSQRLRFRAGQYVGITFDGYPPRDYSMANRPDEAGLEFHVRDVGEGPSRYAVRRLRVGERVVLEGPMGTAWLRLEHRGPILAVAGGTGLAPVKSIVETALAAGLAQPIHLYFGARSERDVYLEERFTVLSRTCRNLRYVPVLSDPGGPTQRRTGLVHQAVRHDLPDLTGFKAYMAGPPAMVEAAMDAAREAGIGDADIHADPFYADAEQRRRLGLA